MCAVLDSSEKWAAPGRNCKTCLQATVGIEINPTARAAGERAIMSRAILNSLAYVSVAIYFVYILVEGWNRLPPIF
jgi:hypothetical protein